jgi:hypothetical protein
MEITHENGRIRICDHLRDDMNMEVMVIVNERSPERREGLIFKDFLQVTRAAILP